MKNTLLENFYTELSSTFTANNQQDFNCIVQLNPDHPIYKGHFEQVPIAPGVCLVQIVKEILMDKFQKELILSSGDNIKFLMMINPKETPELLITFNAKISENSIDSSAVYSYNSASYAKFKGKFTIVK
jgi:3-hydroxyacyl-[acyl-carrier-protein] dehydratase